MNTTMTTGFEHLDRIGGGLRKQALTLIASRDAEASEALILNIVRNAVLSSPAEPTLYFSQHRALLAIERLIACEAGLDAEKIASGCFERHNWTEITTVAARIAEAPLCIVESAHDIQAIRSASTDWVTKLQKEGQHPRLVVFDNVQHIQPGPVDGCETLQDAGSLASEAVMSIEYAHRWARDRAGDIDSAPARIAFSLKELAIELDVPVLAHCCLRSLQSEPEKRVAAFSSALAAFARVADIVGRLELLGEGRHASQAKIFITENIFGATGEVLLAFYPDSFRFADATGDAKGRYGNVHHTLR